MPDVQNINTSREVVERTCSGLCEYDVARRLRETPCMHGLYPPIEASWLHIAEQQLRALRDALDAAEARVKYWQDDSAAAWNKCKERRLQAEQAEAQSDAALAAVEAARREEREACATAAQRFAVSEGWSNTSALRLRNAIRALPITPMPEQEAENG